MSDDPKTTPVHGSDTDQAVANMLYKLREIFAEREAANPTPDPPRDPWVDKPGPLIAAEKEVAQWGACGEAAAGLVRPPRRVQAWSVQARPALRRA